MKLIKQNNIGNFFNKQNNNNNNNRNKTHTQKKRKKENEMKLLVPSPISFHFKQSINQSYDQ